MAKIPRNISGRDLVGMLERKYGYQIVRRSGSHVRLVSRYKEKSHKLTIPDHNPIKIGTLNNILNDISVYLEIDKNGLVEELFGSAR